MIKALLPVFIVLGVACLVVVLVANCEPGREPQERMEVRYARSWAMAHFPDVAVGVTCGPRDDWDWSVCDVSVAGEFVAAIHCSSYSDGGCNRLSPP